MPSSSACWRRRATRTWSSSPASPGCRRARCATPWLKNYLKAESKLQSVVHVKPRCTLAFDCLAQCGLRDGLPGWGQFCIDTQLAAALRGDVKKGLFFRGVGALPFGEQIRGVRELMLRLLSDNGLAPACA